MGIRKKLRKLARINASRAVEVKDIEVKPVAPKVAKPKAEKPKVAEEVKLEVSDVKPKAKKKTPVKKKKEVD
ncbi:MAG: hypothetical protein DRQ54_08400 [Gammaproteobacteria bacterium]|nr:MAG: hypothetical protein DRQ54_08400 [Gammaproteobacteria bacterium]